MEHFTLENYNSLIEKLEHQNKQIEEQKLQIAEISQKNCT